MSDSERAAELAIGNQLPTGLHLNLDQELTAVTAPVKLRDSIQRSSSGKTNSILRETFNFFVSWPYSGNFALECRFISCGFPVRFFRRRFFERFAQRQISVMEGF
jgi:hypothetical protein